MNDFEQMPLVLEKNEQGEPLTIGVQLAGRVVNARIWRADIGRIKLYLLDTNVPENDPRIPLSRLEMIVFPRT